MPDAHDIACFRHLLLYELQNLCLSDSGYRHVLYLYSEVVMLAIRLPQSIEKRLETLARRTGRTKTYYVREAILEHLEDIEDLYLAERALERVRNDEEKTIPLKEVIKRRGSQR
jgi:RHH-type rel operon transcriptional repressor/antitoxin RelB